jgi:hypothetical protein
MIMVWMLPALILIMFLVFFMGLMDLGLAVAMLLVLCIPFVVELFFDQPKILQILCNFQIGMRDNNIIVCSGHQVVIKGLCPQSCPSSCHL